MENKKSYNTEYYGVDLNEKVTGDGYIYPKAKVYGCARIVPPEEREKLRKNKQSNI
jgi:hypothetical protein